MILEIEVLRMGLFGNERDPKRSLTKKEKDRLFYDMAKGRCQNPLCNRKMRDIRDMVVGHKQAWSKNGRTTLKNSVCLCSACNTEQGNMSWDSYLKKRGYENTRTALKEKLKSLTVNQLKALAEKKSIKLKAKVDDGIFGSTTIAPSKSSYVRKLIDKIELNEIKSVESIKPIKKPRKKKKSGWFGF